MSVRAYYDASVANFLREDTDRLLGILSRGHSHALEHQQKAAWLHQLPILYNALNQLDGHIFLEFYIPRMSKRADAVFVSNNTIFVIEFKIGADAYLRGDVDQVEDYALDLKNFHEGSHSAPIVPILIASKAVESALPILAFANDLVARPLRMNPIGFSSSLRLLCHSSSARAIDLAVWRQSGYKPTPTIIEAAQTLYRTHNVTDIARSDASATNLRQTSDAILAIIDASRRGHRKSICFVTGVPGSGKTLAGLNIATRRSDENGEEHAVFLSGNGPLVDVLREALARDKTAREKISKASAQREVSSFIQNIHSFRDEYVGNSDEPIDKVVVFDEAQRAWTREQAAKFMQRKRGHLDFDMSEPEFLISVMDRHPDWCTIICLVGGGQEINTGEAGVSEWISALERRFVHWTVHISPKIGSADYAPGVTARRFLAAPYVCTNTHLHLSVSMRSFRAESLSEFIDHVINNDSAAAHSCYRNIAALYPIMLTRDLAIARKWLRQCARGTERYGLVASSGADRLRPLGIYMKSPIDAPIWFLNDGTDVRSSFYLEEIASEFVVQGLELDWVGVCWDGDFHHDGNEWIMHKFSGTRWHAVKQLNSRLYLKNAYRVILTRARQGMILFVPKGDPEDPTRPTRFYDGTYSYLRNCGIPELTALS